MQRSRDTAGKPQLNLTAVTNNPDDSFDSKKELVTWLNTNVSCSDSNSAATCNYTTANGLLPAKLNGASFLAATSPAPKAWFDGSSVVKQRFFAINTCNGCHSSETNTFFLHIDPKTAATSSFVRSELVARLRNFKNLVCLSSTSVSDLSRLSQPEKTDDELNLERIDVSHWTH